MRLVTTALLLGTYFGVVLVKGGLASWWRIQEMFHFRSPFMYAVLGSAIAVGALFVIWIRHLHLGAADGSELDLTPKPFQPRAQVLGGLLFGIGWSLIGACPGPMYALIGAGFWTMLLGLAAALLGTWSYAQLQQRLPH